MNGEMQHAVRDTLRGHWRALLAHYDVEASKATRSVRLARYRKGPTCEVWSSVQ